MEGEETKPAITNLAVKVDNKIAELSKSIEKSYGEKKEYTEGKLNENPFAYIAGAIVWWGEHGLLDEWGK